jgi:hypothetical protein
MNNAEALVYRMCRQSFLSVWSYMNPRRKPHGKELCDVLVVREPDVIIFSVKQIRMTNSGKPEIDADRWRRKAVDDSCKQIYGAERILEKSVTVVKNDSSLGVSLPSASDRRIHRVAVALGGKRRVNLPFGDFGKGFIHVMNEVSFSVLLAELDTISDFVEYLRAKEDWCQSKVRVKLDGPEENLLAAYLHAGRRFPDNYDMVVVGDGLWQEFIAKPEYRLKQTANESSYVWDRLIEKFASDFLNGQLEIESNPSGTERALRQMARESRFARRILGKDFKEFLDNSHTILARKMSSLSGVVYVFLARPHGTPRDLRVAELSNRCFVARGLQPESTHVVGLATEQYEKGKGFSLDLCNLFKPTWTSEDQRIMEEMQAELGYFKSPKVTKTSEDEYPTA